MATPKQSRKITSKQQDELIQILKNRFEQNMHRHKNINWKDVQTKLEANPDKLWSLNEMENTGGEPDVVKFDATTKEFIFYDCSPESPKGRRSTCYDLEGLESRAKFKPEHNAIDMANEMGIQMLNEEEYRFLQTLGTFDAKTSSWLKTPTNIRELGGAIFGDFRFDTVFVYHNGAQSYYAARGFRGALNV